MEISIDTFTELAGPLCVFPIRVENSFLFTDSLINLHWLNSFTYKHNKMQKMFVFVCNRLEGLADNCKKQTITIRYVETKANPADVLTRPCSYNQLLKSAYLSGNLSNHTEVAPAFSELDVTIPYPIDVVVQSTVVTGTVEEEAIVQFPTPHFSCYKKRVKAVSPYVFLQFIYIDYSGWSNKSVAYNRYVHVEQIHES